jgi:hypothetical protein
MAVSGAMTFLAERSARREEAATKAHQRALELLGRMDTSSDDAVKRFPSIVRSFISVFAIVSTFGAIFWAAGQKDVPVSWAQVSEQKEVLFGLIKWGGGLEVTEIQGVALVPVVTHTVLAIVGAMFGRMVGKGGVR